MIYQLIESKTQGERFLRIDARSEHEGYLLSGPLDARDKVDSWSFHNSEMYPEEDHNPEEFRVLEVF